MAKVIAYTASGNKYKEINVLDVYLNGSIQTGKVQKHWFDLITAGGNGEVSKFLTSDGLTKSGSNTFIFSTIFGGGGNAEVIGTDTEDDFCTGFDKSAAATTGNIRWKFSESNGTGALGGEGLEDTENGTAVSVWIEGIAN